MIQERIEASWLGRAAITSFVLFTLLAVLVSNLPADSHIRRTEIKLFSPYLVTTGLIQGWGVFAPEPTRVSVYPSARIDYEDGTQEKWTRPRGDNVLGAYRFVRWRQFGESLQSPHNPQLHKSFSRWLARTHVKDGKKPTKITLIRRVATTPAPGSKEARKWKEEAFYTLNVYRIAKPTDP